MIFREYVLYAAICDRCGREACYQGHCGYLDGYPHKAEAVERAEGDWATIDGRILCENCRACGRCGTVGNAFAHSNTVDRPAGGIFLCITCQHRECRTCGCGYTSHHWRESHKGNVVYSCYGGSVYHGCPCVGFVEMTE